MKNEWFEMFSTAARARQACEVAKAQRIHTRRPSCHKTKLAHQDGRGYLTNGVSAVCHSFLPRWVNQPRANRRKANALLPQCKIDKRLKHRSNLFSLTAMFDMTNEKHLSCSRDFPTAERMLSGTERQKSSESGVMARANSVALELQQ